MSSLHEHWLGVPSPWAPVSWRWFRFLTPSSLLGVPASTHLEQDPADQRHSKQNAQSDAEHCEQLVHVLQLSASPWVQLLWQISATTQTTKARTRAAARPKTRNANHWYPSMSASGSVLVLQPTLRVTSSSCKVDVSGENFLSNSR